MSRAVSLCTVTDAAFPLEIALQSPGVSDAALAAGPSSVMCSHSFLDSLRWLSNRTAWLFPFCLTGYCLSRHVPAGPPPEVTVIPLLLLCWCLWAAFCEARWRCSRGFGSDCVLQAGKAVQHLLLSLPICPPNLTDALWVWWPWWLGFLPSDYWSLENQPVGRW